jgi:hypothetical protein
MSFDRIVLIALCVAAIGFGLVQTSKSQTALGGVAVVAGGQLVSNITSVWIVEGKQVTACQYQGAGPIACTTATRP